MKPNNEWTLLRDKKKNIRGSKFVV